MSELDFITLLIFFLIMLTITILGQLTLYQINWIKNFKNLTVKLTLVG